MPRKRHVAPTRVPVPYARDMSETPSYDTAVLEPVGVGDDPVRPKSARAMADHPEPCRIRDPEAHDLLDAGHEVVEVTLGFVTIVAMNESWESTEQALLSDRHAWIAEDSPRHSWRRRAGGAHRLGAAAIDALPAFRGTDPTTPT